MKCNSCGISAKQVKLGKSLKIPVTCEDSFDGLMFIDFNDLAHHNPLLKLENIFEVDEKKIIDYLLSPLNHTFTCNQNSRMLMFQKTESD